MTTMDQQRDSNHDHDDENAERRLHCIEAHERLLKDVREYTISKSEFIAAADGLRVVKTMMEKFDYIIMGDYTVKGLITRVNVTEKEVAELNQWRIDTNKMFRDALIKSARIAIGGVAAAGVVVWGIVSVILNSAGIRP